MRHGHSLLWGERVDADALDYGLTTDLLVVCPACKEPVIKVVRTHRGGTTHYLRHRRMAATEAERASDRDCEMRVGRTDPRDTATPHAVDQGHGQDFEAFADRVAELAGQAAHALSPFAKEAGTRTTREWAPDPGKRFLLYVKPLPGAWAADAASRETSAASMVPQAMDGLLAPGEGERLRQAGRDLAEHVLRAEGREMFEAVVHEAAMLMLDNARMAAARLGADPDRPMAEEGIATSRRWRGLDPAPDGIIDVAIGAYIEPLLDGSSDMVIGIRQGRVLKEWFGGRLDRKRWDDTVRGDLVRTTDDLLALVPLVNALAGVDGARMKQAMGTLRRDRGTRTPPPAHGDRG